MTSSNPRWDRISSETLEDYRFFTLRQDISRHPHSGRDHRFFVFEFPDWVNILPITPDGDVIFVHQFRHGIRDFTLEIPGGIVDPGESPGEAGLRELLEESGYRPANGEAVELGWGPSQSRAAGEPLLELPGGECGTGRGRRSHRRHRLRGDCGDDPPPGASPGDAEQWRTDARAHRGGVRSLTSAVRERFELR